MQDANLILSSQQAVTNTSVASTNILDFLIARDIGAGNQLMVTVHVHTPFTNTGTSLQIAWQGDSVSSFSNAYNLLLSPVIPVANLLTAHAVFGFVIPRRGWLSPNRGPLQYYRLFYTEVGTLATGTLDAWITATPDQDQITIYNRNYTV